MKATRNRLLSTTVLPLAVIAAMGATAPAFADTEGCNPCAAASCSACNPCNPCAAANPCGAGCNPCNPCAAANPCGAGCKPCNPCNPCAAD